MQLQGDSPPAPAASSPRRIAHARHIEFAELRLRLTDTGELDFQPTPIRRIAAANRLPDPP